MLIPRLIQLKRDGGALTREQWDALISGYITGAVPDYQMSALLMAICLRGMADVETHALTSAMLESGKKLDLAGLGAAAIDKHSTGGVGDKVSLVLAPLISSLGVAVPTMSGRGLGHTGGTRDKLESIPGFNTRLSRTDAFTQLQRIGCVMMGQTAEIAPADGKLYALRDATATVESIPLMASSIMSKKIAESLDGLVLDVKFGAGAFLPELERGAELARLMISIGAAHGCPTVALQTSMDAPLGRAIGNALEVEEAILALHGDVDVPADLMEVTYSLGAEMLVLAGEVQSHDEAHIRMREAIEYGRALEQFARIVEAQGGNPAIVHDPALLPQAEECEVFRTARKGHVVEVAPRVLGHALVELGGGRSSITDEIDHTVGFMVTVKPGDWVDAGEAVATVFARNADGIEIGRRALAAAIRIEDAAALPRPALVQPMVH